MKPARLAVTSILAACIAAAGCGSDSAPGPRLVAFVTSASGTGNLATWADAGSGHTGLAAGDAICAARAAAAGLPGTFRAWLSDASDDAYCRLHGLSGKKAANCGQSSLPASAGPWVRTDGFPFAGTIDQLMAGVVYSPVRYDEAGALVPSAVDSQYFTGTRSDGTVQSIGIGNPCGGWASATGQNELILGSVDQTTGWSYGASASTSFSCNVYHRLLCLQTGSGAPLPSFATAGKKVFVTSVHGSGNLASWADAGSGHTGLAAGDAICQARAAAAGLANASHFKAWLSVAGTNAIDRLTSSGPWVRIDGVKLASDKTALASATLFSAVGQDETGAYLSNRSIWTGTASNGFTTATTCAGWTSAAVADNGSQGLSAYAAAYWTDSGPYGCDGSYSLYCFED